MGWTGWKWMCALCHRSIAKVYLDFHTVLKPLCCSSTSSVTVWREMKAQTEVHCLSNTLRRLLNDSNVLLFSRQCSGSRLNIKSSHMANTNMSEVKGNEIRFMKKQHRMKWNWTAAEFYTSYSHSFFFYNFQNSVNFHKNNRIHSKNKDKYSTKTEFSIITSHICHGMEWREDGSVWHTLREKRNSI